ncbi:hypothetical protein [Rossellomorea marisflavi]|nr:hypothetical protein [Rossellomorea marisflavi]
MKESKFDLTQFPGRKSGRITVLLKYGENEGSTQLTLDLFKDSRSKRFTE